MPTMWQRDLAADHRRLTSWLKRKLPAARDLRVGELVAPQSSGFSNETLLFDLEYTEAGAVHRRALVVRIEPAGESVFPEYDLALQFRTMDILGGTDVRVPRVCWIETEDRDVLGGGFYIMEQVRGRVPPDQPPYHAAGWMTEIAPAERTAIWWGGIETLARIHRLDYRALGFQFLERPALGATPLDWQIAYYERYLHWATPGRRQPTIEAALDWVKRHRPADEPTVLCWGDARIGNIIFDGTDPAAVLDWEMVALGSPEMDLAWSIFLDRHHSEGIDVPRLEGLPGREETVARYEALTGHTVRHLEYYEIFAAFRFAAIMARIGHLMVAYGIMDETMGREFEVNNSVTRLLAKMLALPTPS
jgi:aminoglycoside phosphotransferase (APT) family kinase protein